MPTREWVAANDFIYWLNGVNDRTFHNATAHSAPLISIDPADVTLADNTEWAPFVDPVPGHVLVYLDKIQFMIGPWWNVTEPDGRVAPGVRSNLLALKRQMYGGLSTLSALAVLGGTGEPIVQSSIEAGDPSVYWHWQIPAGQLEAFRTAANLPAGLSLAPVQLAEGDAPAHWLSLHVYRESGPFPGLRADWSTSVDDGTGTREIILETRTDHRSLDPVDRFSGPFPLLHSVSGTQVSTTIGDEHDGIHLDVRPAGNRQHAPRSCRHASGSPPATCATGPTASPIGSSPTAPPSPRRSRSTPRRSR